MATPSNTFSLKTTTFHPPLVVAWSETRDEEPNELDRPLLMWGASIGGAPDFRASVDPSKRSIGKALTEALGIAKDILRTPGGIITAHEAYAERIAAFATRYGSLWGDIPAGPISRDPDCRMMRGTLRDWYTELLDLFDAVELKKAIVGKRENRKLRKRLAFDETPERMYYKMNSKRPLFLASKGQSITIQRPGKAPQTLDMWSIAQGTSDTFAWATLSRLLEAKLNGHINVGLHPTNITSIALTPSGILPTLFAMVWLDTLTKKDSEAPLVRTCQYLNCDTELPPDAYDNKQYCSDAHRKADERRRKRLQQAHV